MIPIPIASPAGIAKRATDWRKRSGRHGPELGASASRKAGIPIVTVEAIVNWRGSSGKVPVGIATARPTDGGEHGLGDEQPGHPLDVAQDLAPFGDHPGHDAEVVADEHEVGDRARHLRPGALGDRQARLLERGHVVDSVADHRDVAAGARRARPRPRACPRARSARRRARTGRPRAAPLDRSAAPRRRAPAPSPARPRRGRSRRRSRARRRRAPSARPPGR